MLIISRQQTKCTLLQYNLEKNLLHRYLFIVDSIQNTHKNFKKIYTSTFLSFVDYKQEKWLSQRVLLSSEDSRHPALLYIIVLWSVNLFSPNPVGHCLIKQKVCENE